ncbi:MAG: MCE family protein [Mycobacterium sp.]|nr:MCE family protein [Mycobacterium sp.]
MMKSRRARIALAAALAVVLVVGLVLAFRSVTGVGKTRLSAYFENSKGIYPGDEVRILGVRIGAIESIEPEPNRARINFWVDSKYKVPADAQAVILSPSIISARALELTPVYTGGPALQNNAVIPQERTAMPVEWDDLKAQLDKLNQTLQPTRPGGVSTAGEFVNSLADNLRGQGPNIRDSLQKLSQSMSILGDHSSDLFGTVKNLSALASGLRDSGDLLRQLNQNFAAVTATLSNDPGEVGRAVADLNGAVTDVTSFVRDNRETVGITADKLEVITTALNESGDELQQALHAFPMMISNYVNIYQPTAGGVTGALAGTQFSNPINFLCGAIQAASRMGAEQSAKLCVQYLAPIVKNRQYNFLGPIGFNFLVGVGARPNELTYSEDWLRPDYVPPATASQPPATPVAPPATAPPGGPPLPAEAVATNPDAGLTGLMVPAGGGS